jgi:hypothetical protein
MAVLGVPMTPSPLLAAGLSVPTFIMSKSKKYSISLQIVGFHLMLRFAKNA